MLATPHIIAGGAVGKVARRPWIAFPVALGLHFMLDYTPHLDTHALFGSPTGYQRTEVIMGLLDFLFGIALLIAIVGKRPGYKVMYWAGFFGILPDVIDNTPWVAHLWKSSHATKWIDVFHHHFQHNVLPSQWLLGFSTQLAVIAIAIWIIRAPAKAPANPRSV